MRIRGTVESIEEYPDKDKVIRKRIVLVDRESKELTSLFESIFLVPNLPEDVPLKDITHGALIEFWGKPTYFDKGRMGFQVKSGFKIIK